MAVKTLRNPGTQVAESHISQRTSTKVYLSSYRYWSMMAINNRFQSMTSTEGGTSNVGMTVSKCVQPTSEKPTPRQSIETHTVKSTEKSTEISTSQVLPTGQQPTRIYSSERRNDKLTEMSTEKSTRKAWPGNEKFIEASCRERNHVCSRPDGHRSGLPKSTT